MNLWNNLTKAFQLGSRPHTFSATQGNVEDLVKSAPIQGSKSIIEDPLSLVSQLGFKDSPSSLSYDILKRMAVRNSVVASIIQTRINQVSSFSQPARFTNDGVGYEISLRNPKASPTKVQRKMIMAMETFLENCGFSYDPSRDNFDAFLRKVVRDSLVYDQLTFELVPDRVGRPAEFYAVDASTIRAAEQEPNEGDDYIYASHTPKGNAWVQVIDGMVVSEFSSTELAFAVRNPRTDIDVQPYGFSEMEILVNQITSHLWAEEYNSRYFSQGGTTKGVLNLKGTNITKEQMDAFRRQWTAQLAGITGAWKTPVISVEGLEYINVSQSNREMEYEMWMNYLINICSAVWQIDPAEINFPNRGGSTGRGGGGLGEGGIEDRLKNSKDKGLRPLLRFLESIINRFILRRFSNDYTFNFVGLDRQSEEQKATIIDKQVRTYKTVNEIRKEHDLDPLDEGDIILDPTYANYKTQKEQADQMAQQQPQGGDPNDEVPTDDQADSDWEGTGQTPVDEQQQQEGQQDNQIMGGIDEQYPSQ